MRVFCCFDRRTMHSVLSIPYMMHKRGRLMSKYWERDSFVARLQGSENRSLGINTLRPICLHNWDLLLIWVLKWRFSVTHTRPMLGKLKCECFVLGIDSVILTTRSAAFATFFLLHAKEIELQSFRLPNYIIFWSCLNPFFLFYKD